MRVFLGSDHAGFELKAHLVRAVADAGHDPVDCGAAEYDAQDDYPPYCFDVGERTAAAEAAADAQKHAARYAKQLAAAKVPVRDVADLLGLSFQRVSQLVSTH